MLFFCQHSAHACSPLLRGAITLLTLGVLMLGCEPDSPRPGPNAASAQVELSVYAASSLTEAFGELAAAFERAHPNTRVQLHFAGSHVLRAQIENGAPADIFASADPAHIQSNDIQQLLATPQIFAHNDLIIVTPPSNPAGLQSPVDLARATRLIVGTPSVPVGHYTEQFLARAASSFGADFRQQVERAIVSREANTRLVLSKIILQEADAGIVYRSDASARRESITKIPIPEDLNIRADYMIAIRQQSPRQQQASAWVHFVRSPPGQQILNRHGFTPLISSPVP